MVKIKDLRKLQQDVENEPTIRYQMITLSCLLLCPFSNFLTPVLVAAHTVNNLDLSHEQSFENEGYESD